MGQPNQIEDLGTTQIPFDLFMQHLQELAQTTFQYDITKIKYSKTCYLRPLKIGCKLLF